ncbi:peroxidase family protein [Bradyrhizobium sp. McL0616]|uniref:peroxidase family protein n=1 Tax=Bradyrhizobium sp. McL0616 TaxID=3415674 RepID=UPI003CEB5BD8
MVAKHSSLIRGLAAAGADPNFQGRFGRLFPELKGATYGSTSTEEDHNLGKLAKAMVSSFDPPKDGADDEESGIPALYTYLGQFIDHDLTFDPDGSFQKQKDPNATIDFRTPAFDLDNVYGRGPGDQPYMYDTDQKSFLLGDPLTLGSAGARDLQRNGAGRALIGDPRNDENSIVSQLQGLFLRFHNHLVARHPHQEFQEVQKLVRHHYQYMVVNDFLPRIINKDVLSALKTGTHYDRKKLAFFTKLASPFLPVEFSIAAYRLGHSMVRPGYRLNDATLLPIFPLPAEVKPGFPEGFTGFRKLITDWGIDWGRFIDIDTRSYGSKTLDDAHKVANFKRLQLAYRIDTALVDPLGSLPPAVASNPSSLALRNLKRSREFNLPTGQAVAVRMGAPVLHDDHILIGQAVDGGKPDSIVKVAGIFAGNCPLWSYILAEAMQNLQTPAPTLPVTEANIAVNTPQLGPVGGRIVAEVFLGLLFADSGSYLNENPDWKPPTGALFQLKDFVKMALEA